MGSYSSDDEGEEGLDRLPNMDVPMSAAVVTAIHESVAFTLPRSAFLQTEGLTMRRCAIVDWMMRVITKLKYRRETLYNAVYILDKIFTKKVVDIDDVYIIASTCLWMSMKVEETKPASGPILEKVFLRISSGKNTAEDFLQMERDICTMINGMLFYPRPIFFLTPLADEIGVGDAGRVMARFFLDVSLFVFDFVEFPAPVMVVAALAAAMGSSCPIRRLCMVAQCDENLPYLIEIMAMIRDISRSVLTGHCDAINELYTKEQITEFTTTIEGSIEHYSRYRGTI